MARTDDSKKKKVRTAKPDMSRDRAVREQIHSRTTELSRSAAPGAGSGLHVDREFDQIVSEQAPHTKGKGAEEQMRTGLEQHRMEMRLAAIAGANRRREEGHEKAAKALTPEGREKLHNKVERDYSREPGGEKLTKKRAKGPVIETTMSRGSARATVRAAKPGERIEVANANRRPRAGRPGGATRWAAASVGLAKPNFERMRRGGNPDAICPQRANSPYTGRDRDRERDRSRESRSRSAAGPAR